MKVSSCVENNILYLYPIGELDHHGAKKAMTAIESRVDMELPVSCTLDLGNVTFMDSSGIAVILKTQRLLKEIGGKLTVANVPAQAMRVISAAGISRIVHISTYEKE